MEEVAAQNQQAERPAEQEPANLTRPQRSPTKSPPMCEGGTAEAQPQQQDMCAATPGENAAKD